MPMTPQGGSDGDVAVRVPAKFNPDEIDSNWMDHMVKRLFKELHRQLAQVENTKPSIAPDKEDAGVRATNARTLHTLERTMERLARMESERAALRHSKVARKDENARAALERRINHIIAIEFAAANPGQSR